MNAIFLKTYSLEEMAAFYSTCHENSEFIVLNDVNHLKNPEKNYHEKTKTAWRVIKDGFQFKITSTSKKLITFHNEYALNKEIKCSQCGLKANAFVLVKQQEQSHVVNPLIELKEGLIKATLELAYIPDNTEEKPIFFTLNKNNEIVCKNCEHLK